jgi:adenylate cyclase
MNFRDRPRSIWALPALVLALTIGMLASDWGGIASGLRGTLFDFYQRTDPRPYQDTEPVSGLRVRVLDVDAASLARFGPWPWPHAVLARLLSKLQAAGARMAVLAVPLDKPDPSSPMNLAAEIPPGPGFDVARQTLAALPSPDSALRDALTRIPTVTGFMLGGTGRSFVSAGTVAASNSGDSFARSEGFETARSALASFAHASAGNGALNVVPDGDGILRRMPLVFRLRGRPVASLDAETLRLALKKRVLDFRADESGTAFGGGRVSAVEGFGRDIPLGPDASLWIAYTADSPARTISAAVLDQTALASDRVKDAVVYIGSPDEVVATPLGQSTIAGAHAQALENLLLGTALRRPPTATSAEIACLLILGLAAILILARFGALWAGLFTAGMIAAAGGASWELYSANHVLFDALGPGIGLALIFFAGATSRVAEVAAARGRLRTAFADALSPAAIDQIARRPSLLKLEGETRQVTYLFCGIRGFTALAQGFRDDPVTFTRLLARIFTPLMDEALAHRGTVERVTGEGFTCFWNAPLDDPEHAIHACEAASDMTEVIARVNEIVTQERRIDGQALPPIEIGIGISSGAAITGGFRTHGRTTYTAVGACATIAARIQALSATYGPAVIVSEETRKAAERGFAFLEVDYIALGDDAPVKLYAMLGNPVMRASPKFRALTTFHDHIFQSLRTQQWEKARELIAQCRRLSGASQKLYDLQLDRITRYEADPPGIDWDGAFRPRLK